MTEHSDLEKTREELTWLENLQRNSWEPEVIISGITLAFLFAFPSKIYTFAAMLIQDLGVHFILAMLVLLYLSAMISVFKIFFVVHLVLRFIWAGLLGLSYAFPKGVVKEKLFKISQDYEYQKPGDMVLTMERICSMTFAYPISQVFIILVFTVYLGFLMSIYIWLNLSFIFIYLIFVLSLLSFVVIMLFNKKSKLKKKFSGSIMTSVGAIYQSNIGKWFSIFYGLGIFLLSTPLIFNDVRDFSMFFNETNLLENEIKWPTKGLSYAEFHDEQTRYPRAFLPKETANSNFLRLSIARYAGDDKFLEDLKIHFQTSLDTLNWHALRDTPDLYRISIGEKVFMPTEWRRNRVQGTHQKIYETALDISDLPAGTYTAKIEKIMVNYNLFSQDPEGVILREQWDEIDFIKN